MLARSAQMAPRYGVLMLTALAIGAPLAFIFYQSLLSAPFFIPAHTVGFGAFRFILNDPDLFKALRTSLLLSVGLCAIAVPLGGVLAFLMQRTDLPGRRWIEPMILVPVFVSPMVLGFGYVVAAGPVGFFSRLVESLIGTVPWNVYSLPSIIVIAGLTHVPHAYLYISAALRNIGSDMEEAARTSGAGPWRLMWSVSLPMVRPSLIYATALLFLLGLEVFGLVLVLGDPTGQLVMSTYLYKLTHKLGTPAYHLMAAVAVMLIAMTVPLVLVQRGLTGSAHRYITMKGKGLRARPLSLGPWRWAACASVWVWLFVATGVPLAGILLRSFVTHWGQGVGFTDAFSLAAFAQIWTQPNLLRSIVNSVAIGVIGGALSIACYAAIGLTMHRKRDGVTRTLDYLVMIPRAVPGLLIGLAFLWVFLFLPRWLGGALDGGVLAFLPGADWLRENVVGAARSLRSTLFSVWLAYTVVWVAYGLRLISSSLMQVGPELEEAARVSGAGRRQATWYVTLPLARTGLLSAWLLIFLIFEREYSTGVYLLSNGTETIGSMLVSLWGAGDIDVVAALSLINVVIVLAGLALALRLRVTVRD
jgi:iron(III) transport system permease protein